MSAVTARGAAAAAAAARCKAPLKQQRRSASGVTRAGQSQRALVRCAAASSSGAPVRELGALEKLGFNTTEGIVGFTPFAELWTGRAAMLGFGVGVGTELLTGGVPMLQQAGLETPCMPLFYALLALGAVGSAAGTLETVRKATAGELSPTQVARYQTFFGLGEQNEKAALLKMQARAQALDADADANGAAEGTEQGSTGSAAAAASEEEEGTPLVVAAAPVMASVWLPEYELENEERFVKDVELNNGRWAMLGFYVAVTLEALSGDGVTRQLIFFAKAAGLIDDTSGLGM